MIAILSDIHGNIHALKAVLADLPEVSEIWLLGDSVGGGAFPNEVLDTLHSLTVPTTAVLGNWDEFVLTIREDATPSFMNASAIWTAQTLHPHHRDYLKSLPRSITMGSVPGGALLYHAQPNNLTTGVTDHPTAAAIAAQHPQKWLLSGHIHQSSLYNINHQHIATISSVGLPADGLGGTAAYALLNGNTLSFRHLTYDVQAAITALRNSDYARAMPPYILRAATATMLTGRNYLARFVDYIKPHADLPQDQWHEKALQWKVEDGLGIE